MAKMPPSVVEKFADPTAAKFMATVDEEGTPNVVPMLSIMPLGEETLVFADLMMNKTKTNLLATGKVAVAVMNNQQIAYQVKGTFQGFQTSGPLCDAYASNPAMRYNAYSGPRGVGVISVDEVYTACPPLPGKKILYEG